MQPSPPIHLRRLAPPPLPAAPAAAGAQGVISLETLRLYAMLRQLGVKLVVITGRRRQLPKSLAC